MPQKSETAIQKEIYHNFLLKVKLVCEKLVGSGYFELFTQVSLVQMLSSRYAPLKTKAMPGSEFPPKLAEKFNEIFQQLITSQTITTLIGEEVPLGLYLREGIAVIYYVEVMGNEGFPNFEKLQTAFRPYFRTGDFFYKSIADFMVSLKFLTIRLSDLSTAILAADISHAAMIKVTNQDNVIYLNLLPNEISQVKIDGNNREVLRLGWPDLKGKFHWEKIKPSQLLLKNGNDEPLDIYVQRHAFHRMEERLCLNPGLTHYFLYDLFSNDNLEIHQRKESSLVAFHVMEKKVGYLVCSRHDDKIIVRTFLFLTNDGTPEGGKLAELTALRLLDKQYLGIDKLSAFMAYDIAENELLKNLFIKAGCESLLDVSFFKDLAREKISEKNTDIILKYLKGSVSST